MGATQPDIQRHADDAVESVRAMAAVARGRLLPAPFAHDVLGSLQALAGMLPQAFDGISLGLHLALVELDTYEVDGASPIARTADAQTALSEAGRLADELVLLLETAQESVSQQGHRPWK
jgi:hypothetical protein